MEPAALPPARLRIGVDGFNLALARGTGVASYARTLACTLRQMGHEVDLLFGLDINPRASDAVREVLFFDQLGSDAGIARPRLLSRKWVARLKRSWRRRHAVEIMTTDRVERRALDGRLPPCSRILNASCLFHEAAARFRKRQRMTTLYIPNPPDIMHWTYPLPLRVAGAHNIYTIHDLVPLKLPYTTLDDKGLHYRLIRAIARTADGVATVSEASAHDILSFFPQLQGRLFNTYQSLAPAEQGLLPDNGRLQQDLAALFGLEHDGYFLFFGALEPKKNVGRLLEAFLMTRTHSRLVIVGSTGWKATEELALLKQATKAGRVVHLPYLPRHALYMLVSGARAVLFPSLYEGFGLPVLEALAAGAPVLTSREGALPEVAGDCAIYVDAYDPRSMAEGIQYLDKNPQLREALRQKGPEQARLFNTDMYQERLSMLYNHTLC